MEPQQKKLLAKSQPTAGKIPWIYTFKKEKEQEQKMLCEWKRVMKFLKA